MKETTLTSACSACRYCRYYKPEGRRGGSCQMLGAPVESNWTACSLAASPFATTWMEIDEILHLETALSLDYSSTTTPKMAENLPPATKITTEKTTKA
jgi:hypothetical protein